MIKGFPASVIWLVYLKLGFIALLGSGFLCSVDRGFFV